ncbi:MAG: hypothetical protein BPH43C_30 [Phage 5P_1]|nr:MAG: hypothetical protein BPH43C_30 [Phage 5P_1]
MIIMSEYDQIISEVSKTLHTKSAKYGHAEIATHQILSILFPDGIPHESYWMIEPLTRMIEKVCRLVNDPTNLDSSLDLAGYAIMLARLHRAREK